MFIVNIFLGAFIVAIGGLMIKYNYRLVNSFSKNNWFEHKLGAGSTYLIFQIVAVLTIVFGITMVFSFHDNILEWVFSPLLAIFGN